MLLLKEEKQIVMATSTAFLTWQDRFSVLLFSIGEQGTFCSKARCWKLAKYYINQAKNLMHFWTKSKISQSFI